MKIAHPITFTYANFAKVLAGTKTKEVSMSTLPSVQWLKPAEVADHFRVNRKTVYRWIEDKRLPSYDVGGAKRILRNDVLSFAVPTKTEGERL